MGRCEGLVKLENQTNCNGKAKRCPDLGLWTTDYAGSWVPVGHLCLLPLRPSCLKNQRGLGFEMLRP